jgi:hypothetical protein
MGKGERGIGKGERVYFFILYPLLFNPFGVTLVRVASPLLPKGEANAKGEDRAGSPFSPLVAALLRLLSFDYAQLPRSRNTASLLPLSSY